jgi:RNA polymerase sigma factor (sigma-70 family)
MTITHDAFQKILATHEPRLRALVRARLRADLDIDVDDVLQEVRIKLWRAFSAERGIDHLASYIQRTVLSVVIDALRRRAARREEPLMLDADSVDVHAAGTLAPDRLAEQRQRLAEVERAIAELPERRRVPARLLLQGFTTGDIATMLGMSEAAARNLAYRGAEELKSVLVARGMTSIDLTTLRQHLVPVRQCTSDCPDADTLLAFAMGQLPVGTQREQVAERVSACAQCAAAVQLALVSGEWSEAVARDLEAESVQSNVIALVPKARAARRLWIPAALAAGIAAVALMLPMLHAPHQEEVLRSANALLVQPADAAVLKMAPLEFRWTCTDAPAAAAVELLDATAVRVWSGAAKVSAVDDCSATVPANIAAGLGSGSYLWRILSQGGEPVAGPFGFRVEP